MHLLIMYHTDMDKELFCCFTKYNLPSSQNSNHNTLYLKKDIEKTETKRGRFLDILNFLYVHLTRLRDNNSNCNDATLLPV
jgi:hypothetical protein